MLWIPYRFAQDCMDTLFDNMDPLVDFMYPQIYLMDSLIDFPCRFHGALMDYVHGSSFRFDGPSYGFPS